MLTQATKAVLRIFGISDAEHKMRANAANWLELADKVWHFRRDQLSETEARELRARTDTLRQAHKQKVDAAKLKLLIEELEPVLRKVGGKIYPKSSIIENVEFFLVAAIVILGIRTYFVQPFKIPTNSMWPSYYGMTAEVFKTPEERPSALAKVGRFLAFGAQHYELTAPESGEIAIDFAEHGMPAYIEKPGRRWLVFPTTLHEYTLYVNTTPVKIAVPADFRFERVLQQAFFGTQEEMYQQLRQAVRRNPAAEPHIVRMSNGRQFRAYRLPIGRQVSRGDMLLSFDLLTGDQLFVDRVSYHFMRPEVGQGFVFRTDHIEGLNDQGRPTEQYYIKRLVGLPNDTLEIRPPVLYRNDAPITGAAAFEKNARRESMYPGYQNMGRLGPGQSLVVPADSYLALGDNSADSRDGRDWGFVPAKDVVGKPLFIYYPFTKRWGLAR